MAKIRLQRFLAQAGVAARRKAEHLIVDGAVRVNGSVVDVLGSKVDPERDRVSVNGQAVHVEDLFYIVLNKPKGCLTTVSDPQGRRTVMEYLTNVPVTIVPVGRLDYYSEGVLLMTNDGELSAALQSPRNHIEKTYHVKIRGKVRPAHIEAMRKGVRLEDGTKTRPAEVAQLKSPSSHDWLAITLTEGKSRQLRRMAEALGYQVLKLQRIAFAEINFHGLRLGDARELTQAEVNGLRRAVELSTGGRAVSRGKWMVKREQTEYSRRTRERERQDDDQPAHTPVVGRGATSKRSPGGRSQSARAGEPAGRGRPAGRAAKPGGRTAKPDGRAAKPGGRSKPAAKSGGRASKPGGRAAKPGGRAAKPGGRASKPGGRAAKPGGRAAKPGGRAAKPGGRAAKPGGRAAKPGGRAAKPGGRAAKPGGRAAKPGGRAAKPGGRAAKPGGRAAKPGGRAAKPGGRGKPSGPGKSGGNRSKPRGKAPAKSRSSRPKRTRR